MSAAVDLQLAIAAKLASKFTTTVGDGIATTFPIEHGFGTRALYATVQAGETELVNGTDFAIAFTDVNTITLTVLGDPAVAPEADAWTVKLTLLRLDASVVGDGYIADTLPIVPFKTRDMAMKVEGAAAARQLALYIQPPLPKRAAQSVPFVFWEKVEVRVTIIEQPEMNEMGADAYDLVDDVAAALQWQPFADKLAHPLTLAETPTEMIWNPSTRMQGLAASCRMIDVIFEAVYGLQPATAGTL